MRDEHIDLLWDVSQRPDTFEEVKNNVLDLLATLAWHFSGEQLDGLFGRVERAGALKNDCAKILEMVQKLARTDAAGVMAERLLELLWRMLHAGRHERSDDETTAAFARVLGHYARAGSPWHPQLSVEAFMRPSLPPPVAVEASEMCDTFA